MPSNPDLTEFFKLSRPKKKPCSLGFALEQLVDEEQKTQLIAALLNESGLITTAAIQQWLAVRDIDVSGSAVTSHRRKTCSCHD